MTHTPLPPFVAFVAGRKIAAGSLRAAVLAAKHAADEGGTPLVCDTSTGRTVELDLRGTPDDVLARLQPADPMATEPAAPRPRGRPRLGVVAREITLLPRHWDWLQTQPGGASVALRKLVETAQRAAAEPDRRRRAREAIYRFITTMAGDAPGYEAATRALFAGDRAALKTAMAAWPADIARRAWAMAEET
ncbi:hypothetical protein sos41_04680 [Alphaproteobacteria bacterium SO-S41]|nr:hypothetical protein sos41_04680 [Alphaproteobacteria bacterium SO-S41]